MSHIVQGQSQITDIECLRIALAAMGLTLQVGGKPRYYYTGDTHYGNEAIECDYVVPLPGRYDLGLKRQENGTYSFICDSELLSGSFGRGKEGRTLLGENAGKLINEYVYAAAQMDAAVSGAVVTREMSPDGTQYIYMDQYN